MEIFADKALGYFFLLPLYVRLLLLSRGSSEVKDDRRGLLLRPDDIDDDELAREGLGRLRRLGLFAETFRYVSHVFKDKKTYSKF